MSRTPGAVATSIRGWAALTDALQEAQIDEEVGQGVEIGNGVAVAEVGAFDAEGDGLAVDALDGGALLVDILVSLALAVEGVAQASADAGGHRRRAAFLRPVLVLDRAGFSGWLRIQKGADVFAALVLDQADGAVGVDEFTKHRKPCGAQRRTGVRVKEATFGLVTALFGEGNGGKSGGIVLAIEVIVDIPGIKRGVEGAAAGFMAEATVPMRPETVQRLNFV